MQSSSFPPSILTRWLAEFLLTELNVFIQGFSQYGPAYQTNQTLGGICGPKEHLCLGVSRDGEVSDSPCHLRTCVPHPAFPH
uniref:Uncharacterized protein n=1 Tax=Balaenoptera musculus TaxID=9771 RepID=A0A8C0D9D5_BALMU